MSCNSSQHSVLCTWTSTYPLSLPWGWVGMSFAQIWNLLDWEERGCRGREARSDCGESMTTVGKGTLRLLGAFSVSVQTFRDPHSPQLRWNIDVGPEATVSSFDLYILASLQLHTVMSLIYASILLDKTVWCDFLKHTIPKTCLIISGACFLYIMAQEHQLLWQTLLATCLQLLPSFTLLLKDVQFV